MLELCFPISIFTVFWAFWDKFWNHLWSILNLFLNLKNLVFVFFGYLFFNFFDELLRTQNLTAEVELDLSHLEIIASSLTSWVSGPSVVHLLPDCFVCWREKAQSVCCFSFVGLMVGVGGSDTPWLKRCPVSCRCLPANLTNDPLEVRLEVWFLILLEEEWRQLPLPLPLHPPFDGGVLWSATTSAAALRRHCSSLNRCFCCLSPPSRTLIAGPRLPASSLLQASEWGYISLSLWPRTFLSIYLWVSLALSLLLSLALSLSHTSQDW